MDNADLRIVAMGHMGWGATIISNFNDPRCGNRGYHYMVFGEKSLGHK